MSILNKKVITFKISYLIYFPLLDHDYKNFSSYDEVRYNFAVQNPISLRMLYG